MPGACRFHHPCPRLHRPASTALASTALASTALATTALASTSLAAATTTRGWSECQVAPVSEQLGAGCRYFDLRTASVKGKPDLRIVHGLVGGPVLEVLEQVSAFLAANAHEIVILDFQHFYQVSQAQQAALLGQCLELFGVAGCIPPEKVKTATLGELWAAKTRVLLLWGDAEFAPTRPDVLCERPSSILSPWAGDGRTQNEATRAKFRRWLETFMAEDPGDDARLRVLQTVSGPNATMIVTGLFTCANLKSHGRAMNKDVERWFRGAWRPGLEDGTLAVNIVLLDFVNLCGSLVDAIIRLNLARTRQVRFIGSGRVEVG